MKKQQKIVGIAFIALAVLIAVFGVIFLTSFPQTSAGGKNLTIEVIHKDESSKIFEINTNEEFLGPALVANDIIEGEDSEYGMFIVSADGESTDSSKEEWWLITINDGGNVNFGVDQQPIQDGEKYELTFTTGY